MDPLMEQCRYCYYSLFTDENGDQNRLILMTLDRDSKKKKKESGECQERNFSLQD